MLNWRKVWALFITVFVFFQTNPVYSQDYVEGIPDGFTIWATEWDQFSADSEYLVFQFTYDAGNNWWDMQAQIFQDPEIIGESYDGRVFDMGMDLLYIDGDSRPHGVFNVSKGSGHFPSTGTEFQHRVLNADGDWEAVQAPIYSTQADVSPLGVDVYKIGDQYRMTWVEANDEAGPKSLKGEIYDQELAINPDGTVELVGEPTLIYSQTLDWGASYPGLGGLNGVTVGDYDNDGDHDFLISKMFYGGETTAGFYLLEQTSAGVFSESLEDIFSMPSGSGSEAMTACTLDSDDRLDILRTNHSDGAWNEVYWFEAGEDGLVDRGLVLDADFEAETYGISVGHIFGLYASEPPPITNVHHWEVF